MKIKQNIISFAVLLSMLICTFACAQNPGTSIAASDTVVSSTEIITEEELHDNLPESDFEDYDFRILVFNLNNIKTIFVEEMDGNLVNDAVFEKLKSVEDRFNLKIRLSDNTEENNTADETQM